MQVVLEVPVPLLDGVQHQIGISREEVSIEVFWHWYQIKFLNPPDLEAGFLPSLGKLGVFHHADRLGERQRLGVNTHSTRKHSIAYIASDLLTSVPGNKLQVSFLLLH